MHLLSPRAFPQKCFNFEPLTTATTVTDNVSVSLTCPIVSSEINERVACEYGDGEMGVLCIF